MIANDQELQGTQERIAFFYRLLAQMRVTATTPEEYRLFRTAIWLNSNACTQKY